jgi:hypothetical protein
VTWQVDGLDGDHTIMARRVDELGDPVGLPWMPHCDHAGHQAEPTALVTPDGEITIYWQEGELSGAHEVLGRTQ